jgi:hypothetical protein
MNHQPFEDWLFLDEPLTPQENASLQAHLQECTACRQLAGALHQMEADFRGIPFIGPEPGFVGRWQALNEANRQRLHRKQSLAMLAFLILGALLAVGSLCVLLWPEFRSPNLLAWSVIYRLVSMISVADITFDVVNGLARAATSIIPLGGWILIAGALSELGVLWVVSWRLLTIPRRITE